MVWRKDCKDNKTGLKIKNGGVVLLSNHTADIKQGPNITDKIYEGGRKGSWGIKGGYSDLAPPPQPRKNENKALQD